MSLATPGARTSSAPAADPSPCATRTRPTGNPASSNSRSNQAPDSGACRRFTTTPFPAATAAAAWVNGIKKGSSTGESYRPHRDNQVRALVLEQELWHRQALIAEDQAGARGQPHGALDGREELTRKRLDNWLPPTPLHRGDLVGASHDEICERAKLGAALIRPGCGPTALRLPGLPHGVPNALGE